LCKREKPSKNGKVLKPSKLGEKKKKTSKKKIPQKSPWERLLTSILMRGKNWKNAGNFIEGGVQEKKNAQIVQKGKNLLKKPLRGKEE